MYEIHTSTKYKKQRKKLSQDDRDLLDGVIFRLACGESLEQRYRDHALKGLFSAYRECHIKPDLLLIYKRQEDILVLTCVQVGKHSEVFKK